VDRRRRGGRAADLRDAAFWVALAAVPSGLLVGVNAHISTDIGARTAALGASLRSIS